MRRVVLALLAATLASCSAPPTFYATRDDDAVPIYRSLVGRSPNLPEIMIRAFDRDPVDAADLAAAVAAYDDVLSGLARAARAARCEWTHEKLPALTEPFPIDYGISAARVLIVRARMRFAKDNVGAGLEDLLIAARFGSDLQQDRWMIGKLVGAIAIMFAVDELQVQIRGNALLDRHLALIEQCLSAVDQRTPRLETFLRDERRMALSLVDSLREAGYQETLNGLTQASGGTPDPSVGKSLMVVAWDAWLRAALGKDPNGMKARIGLRWRDQLAPLEAETRKPLNARDYDQAMKAISLDSAALSQRMVRHMARGTTLDDAALNDVSDLILGIWRPSPAKLGRNLAYVQVSIEFALLAARLERHRLRTGAYPPSLEETGETPKDPYTGGALVYRRVVRPDGEGCVLAAAGSKDDADRRIRRLVEECNFDRKRFEESNSAAKDDEGDPLTWGIFRRRDSSR